MRETLRRVGTNWSDGNIGELGYLKFDTALAYVLRNQFNLDENSTDDEIMTVAQDFIKSIGVDDSMSLNDRCDLVEKYLYDNVPGYNTYLKMIYLNNTKEDIYTVEIKKTEEV